MTTEIKPDANWTTDELAQYVHGCFGIYADLGEQIAALQKRSALQLFRAGAALAIARAKLKKNKIYVAWLATHKIARSTASEAMALWSKAGNEAAVEGKTITEAKREFLGKGIKPQPIEIIEVDEDESTDDNTDIEQPTELGESESAEGDSVEDDFGDDEPQEDKSQDLPRLNTVLYAIVGKLEQIESWDRSDIDPQQLDGLAAKAISLLRKYLIGRQTADERFVSGSLR